MVYVDRTGVTWLMSRRPPPADGALLAGRGQTGVALEVMRAEGLVERIGAGIYMPADAEVSRTSRAQAFAPLLPRWAVLALGAAAWVHGGPRPHAPFVILTDVGVGPRCMPEGLRVRQTSLTEADVVRVAGVRVTSPARTAVDLARWGEDLAARESLCWLLSCTATAKQTRTLLNTQTRFRHNRRGRQRLRALQLGHDDSHLWGGVDQAGD